MVGQISKLPFNWVQKDKLYYRTITSEIELPFDWPVMTNNYEAEAFCKWKSKRLNKRVRMISYEEWYLLNIKKERVEQNNNLRHFASPCPVTLFTSKIDN